MVLIAPSILAADVSRLREEVLSLDKAGADMIHIDVMDGHFVPNLTFGPEVVKSIRDITKLPLDVHLMVDNPEEMVSWFANAGADIITIHAEASSHLDKIIDSIHQLGCRAGMSLNPATSEQVLEYILPKLDLVLVMTVNPGFGGQGFQTGQLQKIKALRDMRKDNHYKIEVDGGINPMTAAECTAYGADILVAGTSVFCNHNYQSNINALR